MPIAIKLHLGWMLSMMSLYLLQAQPLKGQSTLERVILNSLITLRLTGLWKHISQEPALLKELQFSHQKQLKQQESVRVVSTIWYITYLHMLWSGETRRQPNYVLPMNVSLNDCLYGPKSGPRYVIRFTMYPVVLKGLLNATI